MDDVRDAVLGVAVPLDELLIAFSFFKWIEILTLDILNQREFGDGRFVDLADDCGDRVQLNALRRAPATFTGDDHVAVAIRPKQDGLKNSPLTNGVGKLIQGFFVEFDAGLVWVSLDARDFDLANASAALSLLRFDCRRPRCFTKQRLQSHSESLG